MNLKKQNLLIEYLISSVDTYALCATIIQSEYFAPEARDSVNFIQSYYDEYSALPTPDQISAETGQAFQLRDVTRDKVDYCANEVEKFCRDSAMRHAIMAAGKIYEDQDKEKFPGIETLVRDALTVSLHRNMGVSLFEDITDTLQRLLKEDEYEPSGWSELDDILGGGLARKQMLLLSANSGGGKSIVMANLALNYVLQGKNALYISLELSEDMIYQRYIAMVTGVGTREWQKQVDNIAHKITCVGDTTSGGLFIKRMAQGTNSNQIRAYLKEFELTNGFVPDVICVDYIDLMGSNDKISADNIHEKDKRASEELREIMNVYNAIGITASQQNRGAVTATELNHSHIAGGISKINTTDVYISIIQTDQMRAAGDIAFQFLKTRSSDGVGQTIHLDYNRISLRITDPNGLTLNPKAKADVLEEPEFGDKTGLLGLMTSING